MLRSQFGDEMIQRMTDYLDWVNSLPIEAQCHFAIGLSFFGFVVAAAARETCKRSDVRYLARAIGAASFFAVAAFASHVSHEYEKLNTELMVRKGVKDATSIADPVRVVAVASEYTTTVGDQTFSIVRFTDGQSGSVYRAEKREDRIGAGRGAEVSSVRRCDDAGHAESPAADRMSDGTCGRRF
jgi:hypothetical protein